MSIWNLAAKLFAGDREKALKRKEVEESNIKDFLDNSTEQEVIAKIHQLEQALLWREFRYQCDKSNPDVVGLDLNPRIFKLLTRETWQPKD